jgi:hypothetical protein
VLLEFGPSAAGQSLYYTTYAGGGQVRRVDPPPPPQLATTLTTVTPCRVVDTRAFRPGVTRANNAILGLFGTPAGNVMVASGFAVGTADVVIDVTGWWR